MSEVSFGTLRLAPQPLPELEELLGMIVMFPRVAAVVVVPDETDRVFLLEYVSTRLNYPRLNIAQNNSRIFCNNGSELHVITLSRVYLLHGTRKDLIAVDERIELTSQVDPPAPHGNPYVSNKPRILTDFLTACIYNLNLPDTQGIWHIRLS